MTIFQAYCIDINYDDKSYVLTFPHSDIADEWWRAISDTPAIASLFTRADPQFYTHTASVLNVSTFFTDSRTQAIASTFQGRLFIMMVDDKVGRGLPMVQSVNIANVLNGHWFYIRTVATPHYYWYYDASLGPNSLTISETARTRFQIQVPGLAQNKVVTNQDAVTLRVHGESLYVIVDAINNSSGRWQAYVRPNNRNPYTLDVFKRRLIIRHADKCLEYLFKDPLGAGRTWEFIE